MQVFNRSLPRDSKKSIQSLKVSLLKMNHIKLIQIGSTKCGVRFIHVGSMVLI